MYIFLAKFGQRKNRNLLFIINYYTNNIPPETNFANLVLFWKTGMICLK